MNRQQLINENVDKFELVLVKEYQDADGHQQDNNLNNTKSNDDAVYLLEEDIMVDDIIKKDDETDDMDPDQYHCSTCDMEFISIEQHIAEFHQNQEVEIQDEEQPPPECIVSTKHDEADDLPETIEYMEEEKFSCKLCWSNFTNKNALSAHMRIHKLKSMDEYVKDAIDVDGARKTRKEALIGPNQQFVCYVCDTNFMSNKSLKLHVRMHKPVKPKSFKDAHENESRSSNGATDSSKKDMFFCEICTKFYDNVFKEIHMKTHDDVKKFSCTSCNIAFDSQKYLDMHIAAHQKPREFLTKMNKSPSSRPYECQYCNKAFARPHEKVKHERIHTGEKPHGCEICGKTFRVSYCLSLHMRTHSDDRPFVCPHCNKRYKAHSVYNHHLLTHSDVRNFQCPFCPKTFKTQVQLSGHKNSHTKPFSCSECNRPFATFYAVKAHMASHKLPNHNLKHACPHCGASYTRVFALKNHIKEQHPEQAVDIIADATTLLDDEFPLLTSDDHDLHVIDDDQTTLAGQSIKSENLGEEVTIGEIEHFANEEIVTDWMK